MSRWIGRDAAPLALLLVLLAAPAAAQDYGFAGRAYLGIYMTELTDATRKALGLQAGEGVLIEDVVRDQPADKAGLRPGDVILEMDGRKIGSSSRVSRLLDRAEPGDELEVIVWRDAKRLTLKLQVARRRLLGLLSLDTRGNEPVVAPRDWSLPALGVGPALAWSGTPDRRLGIRTQELTGQLAEYFEVGRGLLISWVVRDSPAGRAGLRAGDVLISLAGQPIVGEEDLGFVLREEEEDRLTVVVVRRGEKKSFTLEL